MWQLDNKTPYAADHGWTRDADGAEVWIVAVKATYELLPDGSTRVAACQPQVNEGLVLHDDNKSPLYETDLGPAKLATDVWLVGHAHSQTGKPLTRMPVAFAVGAVSRQFQVIGDRHRHGVGHTQVSSPTPFVSMPLTWARALGGDGPDCKTGNPVGCGIAKAADGSYPLPNLDHASKPQGSLMPSSKTEGVGPVLSHWPERSQYAGTYDNAWQASRAPLQAADLQPAHWQVAPKAQQVLGHLKGGEAITLEGLTPAGYCPTGILRSQLPKLTLGFSTRFYDGSAEISRSVIHSVILQPDGIGGSGPLVSVVHHMTLPCHSRVNQLERTLITEKQRPLDKAAAPNNLPGKEQAA